MTSNQLYHIGIAGTYTIKPGAGYLEGITINTAPGGAVTVYDSLTATGTKLAVFPSSAVVGTYEYHGNFYTGLTVVVVTSGDLTVTYT